MEIPNELRIAIGKLSEGTKNAKLRQDAQNISLRYRTESGQGKRLLTLDTEAIAYSISRMPATYGAIFSSLKYALELSDCNLQSLLDVGAGTGAASWAADSLLDLNSVVCLEREAAMQSIGRKLMQDASEALRTSKWMSHDLIVDPILIKADLVIASYVLNELSELERLNVVNKLWDATDKMILIVEPGTPVGYKNLMNTRDFLLEKGANMLAPCTHEYECQLSQDDWCHFKCRIPRSRLHKQLKDGDVPYEDEKFIYMAMTREKYSFADARIIRHPNIEKGRITLDICSSSGIEKLVVSKKDGDIFKVARKAKCGDQITKK